MPCVPRMTGIAAAFCTHAGRPPIRPTRDFAQALESSGLPLAARARVAVAAVGCFSLRVQKRSRAVFLARRLLGFSPGMLLLVVPGLAP